MLRTATHDIHRRVERRLHLVDPALTRSYYIATLRGLFVAYIALEDQIEPHGAALARLGIGWPGRRKVPLIRADLAALGSSPTSIMLPPLPVPAVPTLAAALGCMYVMEGATLGGAVISRNVRARLQLGPTDGAAFFASYGDDATERWHEFCRALELGLIGDAARREAVETAVATFDLIDACIGRGEP